MTPSGDRRKQERRKINHGCQCARGAQSVDRGCTRRWSSDERKADRRRSSGDVPASGTEQKCPWCGGPKDDTPLPGQMVARCRNAFHAAAALPDTPAAPPSETRKQFGCAAQLCNHLSWALEVMKKHEIRLILLGDPVNLVRSEIHVRRRTDAQDVLEAAWQECNEHSPCQHCRDGNIPIDGWHSYVGCVEGEDHIPCRASAPLPAETPQYEIGVDLLVVCPECQTLIRISAAETPQDSAK